MLDIILKKVFFLYNVCINIILYIIFNKVNNPAGLDEATLNSLIAQATEAITQQQIIQVKAYFSLAYTNYSATYIIALSFY